MRFANLGDRPVVIVDGRAHPIPGVGSGPGAFIDAIARWDELRPGLGSGQADEGIEFEASQLGPPVPRPGKILGAPVNYLDHRDEMKVEHTVAGLGFFLKSPSSITGPSGSVRLPFPGRRTDQEAELGVVIGRTAERVSRERALDHVFGYTCLVDVTVRGTEERSTRKSFAGFTPIGPWITTADEIPDPTDLRLRGWVNGELRQDTSTSRMVYGVAELIEFMSTVVPLEPGDVIATGTPAGVGPVVGGDVISVDLDRVGTLEVPVLAPHDEPHELWLVQDSP